MSIWEQIAAATVIIVTGVSFILWQRTKWARWRELARYVGTDRRARVEFFKPAIRSSILFQDYWAEVRKRCETVCEENGWPVDILDDAVREVHDEIWGKREAV